MTGSFGDYLRTSVTKFAPYLQAVRSIFLKISSLFFQYLGVVLRRIGRTTPIVSAYIFRNFKKNSIVIIGIATSLMFLCVAWTIFSRNRDNLQLLDAYGSFISGILASVAFIWIVIAGWTQHNELKNLVKSNDFQYKSLEVALRMQRLEILRQFENVVIPMIYKDCFLLISAAVREGHITDFLLTSDDYSYENHNLLIEYIETSNQLQEGLSKIRENPANTFVLAIVHRLRCRISLAKDIQADDIYLLGTSLQPSDIAAYRFVVQLFDKQRFYRESL